MRFNKKAALELSVNAIVILIIAIVMLGLGLGFVRTLFGGASNKFGALIDQEQDPSPPSSSNIITLSRSLVATDPRSNNVIKLSVYNPTGDDWIGGTAGSCDDDLTTSCSDYDTNSTTCGILLGCTWNSAGAGSCDDDAALDTDCTKITDDGACAWLADNGDGCTWTPGTGGSGVSPKITCTDILTTEDDFTVNTKNILSGEYQTFDVLFTIPDTAEQGESYLCQIEIEDVINTKSYYKDFAIKVK